MRREPGFKQVSKDKDKAKPDVEQIAARIREAGSRAVAEAEARRARERRARSETKEVGGADGPEPTRYGDWERKGLISDF